MNLRNYTSSVSVSQSIQRIEMILVEFGAQHISKTYDPDKTVNALIFSLPISDGRTVPVRLPVRSQQVEVALRKQVRRQRPGRDEKIKDQAGRTAWKLMHDWIHVQLSLISMGQAMPLEVFLPYVYDKAANKTVYEAMESNQFKALPFTS